MASLMAPTVEPSAGITQRMNSFESDMSPIRESQKEIKNSLGQFNQIAKTALQFQLEAHNAANEAKLTDYSLRLQKAHADILNDLKSKTNKDAVDAREGVMQSFTDVQDKLASELANEDPSVIDGFKQQAQKTLYNSQTNADAYVIEQSIRYRDTQRAAQVENLGEQMALHMDNPVLYSKAMEDFRAARAQQDDELGIEAGSDASKVMDRKVTDSIYGSEITKLIGLKKFGNADRMLKNAKGNEFITANTYNRAIVDLFTSREAAARQAEMDAQRRARFKAQQAKDAWDIKNAMAKNELLKDQILDKDLKNRYADIPEYKLRFMKDQFAKKMMAETDAHKYKEVMELDPMSGVMVPKLVERTPEERQFYVNIDASKYADGLNKMRNIDNAIVDNATNLFMDAVAQGNGDSALARVDDYLSSLPESEQKKELQVSKEVMKEKFSEAELETMAGYKYGITKPKSTDLANDIVSRMPLEKIPVDANGKTDMLAMRKVMSDYGISNYNVTTVRERADARIAKQQDAKNAAYNSRDMELSRDAAVVSVASALLNEGLIDDSRFSFNAADAKNRDPAVREKYAAGRAIVRRLLDDVESQVAGILDPNERNSRSLRILHSYETKEKLKRYAEDDSYDRNLMTVDQLNSYEESRIKEWQAKQKRK